MKLIYQPHDGGERREWLFQPDRIASDEAEALEDVFDAPYNVVIGKLMSGSIRATRAVLWVLLRRQDPRLTFGQVRFTLDEVWQELDDEELQRMRERLPELEASDDPLDQAVAERWRETLAANTEAAADEVAAVGEAVGGVEAGKDTAPVDATANST